jgi:hypothetical protein
MKLLTIKNISVRPPIRRSELAVALQLSPVAFFKMTSLDVGRARRPFINRERSTVPDAGTPSS